MNSIKELTRDADRLLCLLYKDYLNNIKNGLSRSNASFFGDSNEITEKYLPDWDPEDTSEICWELHTAGYVTCTPGDDIANNVTFQRDAILYMENRFKNGLMEVIDFIAKFM